MSEPYGYTIFCDDIREEVGSKASYMGRYLNEMIVGANAPVALPKFAVATHILLPLEMTFERGRLALQMVTGDEVSTIQEVELSPERPELPVGSELFMIGVNFVIAPFPLPGDCRIQVRAYFDEVEVKAGALLVRFHGPTPPAEASTPAAPDSPVARAAPSVPPPPGR